ncbi:MAG TPA: TrbI/VirB10 family protein [Candidatus Dormibacteraeota bacterium]|nr:TrbI/VirB10 family protein [Candidatus Dormibacteraeota bacterium]
MDPKHPSSPVELVEKAWRGPVLGVIKISAKAGFMAALLLAGLVGLIVYGISTAGHRRASNLNSAANLTKASEQQTPWWNAIPNAQPSALRLPTLPVPAQIPPLLKQPENSVHVPALAPISATQMQAAQLAHEREERRRALLDAAQAAPVMVRLNENGTPELTGATQPAPGAVPSAGAASGLAGNASQPRASESGDERDAFLTSAASTSRDRIFAARQNDPSPYGLHAGSVIPAVLLSGINADLPGTIVAQVRTDVFDSVTGRYLLIPRGTRLVGTYDNRIVRGQRRVLVAWTRLLYPDGSSVDLLGMPGTDEAGYAGFGANVNEHLNKVFTSALLLSIIGAGAQLSQPQQPAGLYAAPSVGQTIAGAFGQQIGNTSIQLTQRQLEIPPTLEVPPGYLFNVLVDRDIVLMAPYADGGPR